MPIVIDQMDVQPAPPAAPPARPAETPTGAPAVSQPQKAAQIIQIVAQAAERHRRLRAY